MSILFSLEIYCPARPCAVILVKYEYEGWLANYCPKNLVTIRRYFGQELRGDNWCKLAMAAPTQPD